MAILVDLYSVSNFQQLSPLHSAACSSELDTVKYLIQHGADVNIRNEDGVRFFLLLLHYLWLT